MATLWFNFPQNDISSAQSSNFPKQPDVDFLVPMSSRFTAMAYAKEVFTMLKADRSPELQKQFVWEPLKGRGGSGESDILNTDSNGYVREYPLWRDDFGPVADGNGYFVLAQIRTDEFWLNICLGDIYFTPFQKVQQFPEDELIYSKIARVHRDDAKELFRTLTTNVAAFNALVHVGMGVGEAQREEPYCFLDPTATVEELDAELEAYMTQ